MATDPVLAAVASACADAPRPLLVGLSGGPDSTVLLEACVVLGLAPIAVHIHHGLQDTADAWAAHCAALCARLGVPLHTHRVAVTAGPGPEAAARTARYRAFAGALAGGGTLLLGHHRDDQAETLLLRLLRGAGARGLAGMAAQRPLGAGEVRRPLLHLARSTLAARLAASGLATVADPSNTDTRLRRNALRHQVLPALEAIQPGASASLARSAGVLGGQAALEAAAGAALLRPLLDARGLDLPGLAALDPLLQPLVLRAWAAQVASVHGAAPPVSVLQRLQAALDAGGPVPDGELHSGPPQALRVGCWRQRAVFLGPPRPAEPLPAHWDPQQGPLQLSAGSLAVHGDSGLALLDGQRPLPVFGLRPVRSRQRLRPAWRRHSQDLKRLCQEAGVPPWARQGLPMLTLDGAVVAVPGVGVDAALAPAHGARGRALVWRPARLLATLGEPPADDSSIVGAGPIC